MKREYKVKKDYMETFDSEKGQMSDEKYNEILEIKSAWERKVNSLNKKFSSNKKLYGKPFLIEKGRLMFDIGDHIYTSRSGFVQKGLIVGVNNYGMYRVKFIGEKDFIDFVSYNDMFKYADYAIQQAEYFNEVITGGLDIKVDLSEV